MPYDNYFEINEDTRYRIPVVDWARSAPTGLWREHFRFVNNKVFKYPVGTKLRVLTDTHPTFTNGQIVIVELSRNHPESYAFKGISDNGWITDFVDHKGNFEVIPLKIENWRERIK